MKIHEEKGMERNLKERERIGKRLAELRKKRKMTQEELANLCGVNRVNISKIEKGAYNVSIDILSKVAFSLGYEVDVKVKSSVTPLRFAERVPVELVVGEEYYVSFGSHEAKKCKLVEIVEKPSYHRIEIEVVSHKESTRYVLFPDEIGRTPEEAVINEVTF